MTDKQKHVIEQSKIDLIEIEKARRHCIYKLNILKSFENTLKEWWEITTIKTYTDRTQTLEYYKNIYKCYADYLYTALGNNEEIAEMQKALRKILTDYSTALFV